MKIRIILWITIMFSAVLSPLVKADEITPCCILLSRKQFEERSCQWFYVKQTWWISTSNKFNIYNFPHEVFELCTTFNRDTNLFCRCPYGWDIISCTIPRVCTVSQHINDTVSESMSDDGRSDSDSNEETTSSRCISAWESNRLAHESKKTLKKTKKNELRAMARHVRKKWMDLPKCKPKCLGEINTTNLSHIQFKNIIYYAIPIDSSCNKEAPPVSSTVYPPDNKEVSATDSIAVPGFLEKYQFYLIGVAIGIILFAVTVYISCIRRNIGSNAPIERVYDDVHSVKLPSNGPSEDDVELEYDYVDPVHFRSCCQSDQCMAKTGDTNFCAKKLTS